MKIIATFFTVVAFVLTVGTASAQQEGAPWLQKEPTPLIKSKGAKENAGSPKKNGKKEKKRKKQRTKKQKKENK